MAIARAIVTQPALILADEPTGNLDSASTVEIMQIFCRLNAEGRTIVVITHETAVAEHVSRVIELVDGRLHADRRQAPLAAASALLAAGSSA